MLHALHPYPQSQVVSLDIITFFLAVLSGGTTESNSPKTIHASAVSLQLFEHLASGKDSKLVDGSSISLRRQPLSATTCHLFLVPI